MSCAPASCIGGDAQRSAARSTAAQPCAHRGQEEVCVAASDIKTSSSSLLGNDERRSEGPSSGRGEHGVRSRHVSGAGSQWLRAPFFHFLCGTNFTAGRKNAAVDGSSHNQVWPRDLLSWRNTSTRMTTRHATSAWRCGRRAHTIVVSKGDLCVRRFSHMMSGSAALSSVSRVARVTWELKVTSIGCGPAATLPCLSPSVGPAHVHPH